MNQDEMRASIKAERVTASGQDPSMDIVDRLRERAAADEIERLRSREPSGGRWISDYKYTYSEDPHEAFRICLANALENTELQCFEFGLARPDNDRSNPHPGMWKIAWRDWAKSEHMKEQRDGVQEYTAPFMRLGFALRDSDGGLVFEVANTFQIDHNDDSIVVDGRVLDFKLSEMQHVRIYVTEDPVPLIGSA